MTTDHRARRRHRRPPTPRRILLHFAASVAFSAAFALWVSAAYTVPLSGPGAAIAAVCAASVSYLAAGLYRLGGRA
jgi:hypothetical protein